MSQRFTIGMQIACVERELRLRRQVYPGLVARKKLSQREADLQIGCMEAVLETLKNLKPTMPGDPV